MKSQSIDAINPSKLKIREAAEPGTGMREINWGVGKDSV